MNKLNLEIFEVITAITQTYQEDIEAWVFKEFGEIEQIEVAQMVMDLYFAYMEDNTPQSLLSLIQNKHITIDEIV